MSDYKDAEKKGRDITIQIFGSKINLVELDQYSRADFSGSTTCDFLLETKYRNTTSKEYNNDMLEYEKFIGLKELAGEKMNIFYLNIFTDHKARLYKLNELFLTDIKIFNYECPVSSTEPEKGFKNKISVGLPLSKAYKYTYK